MIRFKTIFSTAFSIAVIMHEPAIQRFSDKKNCTAGRIGAISLVSMERALNCIELGLFSNREFSVTWPGVCK